MGENKKDLAVIMPALNEELNIAQAIDNAMSAFVDYGIDGEIIVVNDGSIDNTLKIVMNESVKYPGKIKVINHDLPKGIGASFWDGIDIAGAGAVVMLPGDNENDPWEIFRYLSLLDHVDMVIPFIFNREARSIFRNMLSFAYRFIINTTFMVNFNYTNGTVLYRKSILNSIRHRSLSFFFQTDILVRAVKMGYLFAEVPYKLGIRKEGISKAVSFPSLIKVARGYLKLVKDYYLAKKEDSRHSLAEDSMTSERRKKSEGQVDNAG